jgi:uncharacterized protein (DUF58 family)
MAQSKKRSKQPRRPVITREGWLWLIATAGLWTAGVWKGINLLTMLGCTLGVVWILNALLVVRALRHLQARRRLPEVVFAGTPCRMEVEIFSAQQAPRYGVTVSDGGAEHLARWFVPRLDQGNSVRLVSEQMLKRRGRYTVGPLVLSTSAPFGLLQAEIQAQGREDLVVFPRLGRFHRGALRHLLRQVSWSEGRVGRGRPTVHLAQTDWHGVRAFRSGDSPRWIHWRTSARRGELMVRDSEEVLSDNLILVLDAVVTPERKSEEALEAAIRVAATICWEWCRQSGDRLILAIAGHNPIVLRGSTGAGLARQALEKLALEPGRPRAAVDDLLQLLSETELPAGPVLLISPEPPSFHAQLAACCRRPVTILDASDSVNGDFYQG